MKRDREQVDSPDFPLRTIVITPNTKIDLYRSVAKDFIERIIELPFERVFITDRSSLWDFSSLFDFQDVRKHLLLKIKRIYGVDVSDIEDGYLVKIFERLA